MLQHREWSLTYFGIPIIFSGVLFNAVLDFPAHWHHLSVISLLRAASLSPACCLADGLGASCVLCTCCTLKFSLGMVSEET